MEEIKITLCSSEIFGDDIASFETFVQNLSIDDLLALNKIITDETNERITTIIQERQDSR